MSSSVLKQYSFGPDGKYFFEFKVHTYVGVVNTITTIMLNATNVRTPQVDLVRQNVQGLVEFLANLCIQYNANYDGYHNYLDPLSSEESDQIVVLVNAAKTIT